MSDSGILRQLFPFNPAGFNPIAGAKLFAFALVAGAITIFTDLNLVVVIIGALLAWLTDIPGTTTNRRQGAFRPRPTADARRPAAALAS